MEDTDQRFASRCLPLLMANQSGWIILNGHEFQATWTGGKARESLHVEYAAASVPSPLRAVSHFGYGILSWSVPYLFRTPPGYNLLTRGPANWPKDGACALEGLVETDWAVATFTMNWKLTRPGLPVTFGAEEPFCMVVPQRRGELESFDPQIRDLADDPKIAAAHDEWGRRRHATNVQNFLAEHSRAPKTFDRHYFQGSAPDGRQSEDHQTRLRLAAFAGAQAPGDEA